MRAHTCDKVALVPQMKESGAALCRYSIAHTVEGLCLSTDAADHLLGLSYSSGWSTE